DWVGQSVGRVDRRSRARAESNGIEYSIYLSVDWNQVLWDQTVFYPLLFDWLRDQDPSVVLPGLTNYARWKHHIGAEQLASTAGEQLMESVNHTSEQMVTWTNRTSHVDADVSSSRRMMLRWAYIEVPLNAEFGQLSISEGEDLAEAWEQWYQLQRHSGECKHHEVQDSRLQLHVGRGLLSNCRNLAAIMASSCVLTGAIVLASTAEAHSALAAAACMAVHGVTMTGFISILGWKLGSLELAALAFQQGHASDMIGHVVAAYMISKVDVASGLEPQLQCEDRLTMALTYIGVSIVGTALPIASGAFLLTFSSLEPWLHVGVVYLIGTLSAVHVSLASPVARRHVNTDGEAEWIRLCPPGLQTHVANTAHLLHDCGGRDDGCTTLRSHSIANVPDTVILPILQACPNCLINKAPPPMRHTTAIRPRAEERVQCWDVTMFGEGTEGQIQAVDLPGNYHKVFHIDTEKARHAGFSYCLLWQASFENNADMADTQSDPDVLHAALEELLQFFPLSPTLDLYSY
ncbi:hypothetical protein CYMTET_17365, partial [Cymbomonas tetramitiformis]